MARRKTMYGPARFKKYSEIVDMDNPEAAKGSVDTLKEEFKSAKTGAKKLRVARATQLAANRAIGQLQRENLSPKERREFQQIQDIYDRAAEKFFKEID